ncbi:MAG: hypothetical protein ACLGSD_17325 [Acidobacteriota bacterium]
MITTLRIPSPLPTPIQRLHLLKLMPPVTPQELYCGIVRRREGDSAVCAVVHSYRTAHLYAAAFPALLPLLLAEVCRDLQMPEVAWADIVYTSPDGARPQLLVRTTRLGSAAAEVVWQDRDQRYARSWESRVWPIVRLLDRIKSDRTVLDTPDAGLSEDGSAAPPPAEGGRG